MSEDLALTGIPRSGTTLFCALLNASPDAAVLDEPIDPAPFVRGLDERDAVAAIGAFFSQARTSLRERSVAPSLHSGGRLPDNHFAPARDRCPRPLQVSRGHVRFDVREDARLVAKHPVLFTAFLGALAEHMPCAAVVRNPLAVLASWNSVDIAPRAGRLPVAEANDPSLRARIDGAPDTMARQLELLSWFFERYEACLPPDAVVRYEDIVRSDRRSPSAPAAGGGAAVSVEDRNRGYDPGLMRRLAQRLLPSDGAYWDFYTRAEVEALL